MFCKEKKNNRKQKTINVNMAMNLNVAQKKNKCWSSVRKTKHTCWSFSPKICIMLVGIFSLFLLPMWNGSSLRNHLLSVRHFASISFRFWLNRTDLGEQSIACAHKSNGIKQNKEIVLKLTEIRRGPSAPFHSKLPKMP